MVACVRTLGNSGVDELFEVDHKGEGFERPPPSPILDPEDTEMNITYNNNIMKYNGINKHCSLPMT